MEHFATAQQVFAAGLIFARVGAMVMLVPGIGETYVPTRVRLSFAFLLALVLFPIVGGSVPPEPAGVGDLAGMLIKEILIGLMLGTILKLFVASLATTGELISIQTTISFAQTTNPTEATPSSTIGTFLALLGLVLIMTTNLHHLFLGAIVRSYTLFPFNKPLPTGDAAQLAIQAVGKAFALGLQLAAPVIVFALVFNIATGLVGRVMPQFQVFFIATPIILLLGLSIFALSLGLIGMVWIDRYREFLQVFG